MSHRDFQELKNRHLSFWEMKDVKQPLIGFTIGAGLDSWSYWQYNKAAQAIFSKPEIHPEDIDPHSFIEDQKRYLELSEQVGDDVIRTAMPLASVPWMEAILGCPIISSGTHLSSRPVAASAGSIEIDPFNPRNLWVEKYLEFLHVYRDAFEGRYPVAQSVLRGPSDLACALIGAENATVALLEEPEAMRRLLVHVTHQEEQFLRHQQQHLPPFHDGWVIGQYEIWAPGTVLRMQEDFSTLYSPKLYAEFLKPLDRRLAGVAEYTLIHLHAPSLFLIDQFLDIPEIAVFQVTKDPGTANLPEMMSALVKIQVAGKPLVVKGQLDESELALLKEHLSPRGLCIQPVVKTIEEATVMLPRLRTWRS